MITPFVALELGKPEQNYEVFPFSGYFSQSGSNLKKSRPEAWSLDGRQILNHAIQIIRY
jgi:hypothetical protein